MLEPPTLVDFLLLGADFVLLFLMWKLFRLVMTVAQRLDNLATALRLHLEMHGEARSVHDP